MSRVWKFLQRPFVGTVTLPRWMWTVILLITAASAAPYWVGLLR